MSKLCIYKNEYLDWISNENFNMYRETEDISLKGMGSHPVTDCDCCGKIYLFNRKNFEDFSQVFYHKIKFKPNEHSDNLPSYCPSPFDSEESLLLAATQDGDSYYVVMLENSEFHVYLWNRLSKKWNQLIRCATKEVQDGCDTTEVTYKTYDFLTDIIKKLGNDCPCSQIPILRNIVIVNDMIVFALECSDKLYLVSMNLLIKKPCNNPKLTKISYEVDCNYCIQEYNLKFLAKRWKLLKIIVSDLYFDGQTLYLLTRTNCGDTIWKLKYSETFGGFYYTIEPYLLCGCKIQFIPPADIFTKQGDTWLLINSTITAANMFKLMYGKVKKE